MAVIGQMGAKGVEVKSLTDPFDTTSRAGRLIFRVIASIAEFEHDLMWGRTRAGLATARAAGRHPGRRPSIKPGVAAHIERLAAEGMPQAAIAEAVVSRYAVGRYLAGLLLAYSGPDKPPTER